MKLGTSLVFPSKYVSNGKIWEIKPKERRAKSISESKEIRDSPLPGPLSKINFPSRVLEWLWQLRELPSKHIKVRAYIHRLLEANLRLGPQASTSFILALAAVFYYNLVAKPWWLTNILATASPTQLYSSCLPLPSGPAHSS